MADVPRLTFGHAKSLLKIAMSARGGRIPRADRWKFIDLIFEGAQAFTSRPLPPPDRRQAFLGAAAGARSFARHLGSLLQSDEPLFEAGGFARTLALQHQLIALANYYESNTPPPTPGRPRSEGHFLMLVSYLDQAWQVAVGRPGGATWYPPTAPGAPRARPREKGIRAGPFVDFVDAVLKWLEPTAPGRRALGDSVRDALTALKAFRQGENT